MKTTMKTPRLLSLLLTMATVFCLAAFTACSDKNEDEPAGPDNPSGPTTPTGDEFTVKATGGTVEKGDIAITFPSGTFTGETKVYVTEVTKGEIRNEDEASTFYQVTMPAIAGQPISVKVNSDKTDADIILVAHILGSSLDGQSLSYHDYPLETTYQNGTYTAEFTPDSYNEDTDAIGTVSFGLIHSADASTQANARSNTPDTRSASNGDFKFNFDWGSKTTALVNLDLQDEILRYMNEAVGIIKGLGFKVEGDRKIPIIIEKEKANGGALNQDEYGRYEMSFWGKKYGYILINDGFRTKSNINFNTENLRKTCIHELLHYFQADYDPRCAWSKGGIINSSGESLILYECGGVWVEQFMNNGQFSTTFIAEPERSPQVMRGLGTVIGGNGGYQPHGYGASIFLEYMSQQKGKDKIVKLYETWKKSKKMVALDVFQDWAKEIGSDVFSSIGFDDFILDVSKANTVNDFSVVTILRDPKYNDDKKIISKDETISYSGDVNPYGGRYANFQIYGYNGSLKDKQLTFTEAKDGVMTYAYLRANSEYKFLGTFTSKDTLTITDQSTLEDIRTEYKNNKLVYLITTNSSNSSVVQSEIKVTLGEQDRLKLIPDELTFDGKAGLQTITADTNFEELDLTPSASWMSATFDKTAKQITVSVETNTGDKREGTITVKGGELTATIKVTQQAGTGNIWKLVKTTIDNSGAHRENSWTSDVTGGNGSYSYRSTWMDGKRQSGLDHDDCTGESISSTLSCDQLKDSYKPGEVIQLNVSWTYTDCSNHPFNAGPMTIAFQYVYSTGSYGWFTDENGKDTCPHINSINGTGGASNGGFPASGSGYLASPSLKTGSAGQKLEIRMSLGNIWPSYKAVYEYEWIP